MDGLIVYVDGIGFWAPGLEDWPHAERVLNGEAFAIADANAKPSPASLAPAERRRAPEPVLLACEAASQACAMAARDPAALASVFASTSGDLAITDAMCATLAADPRELSPTRFHNSVHNAPAGYWTVAMHCHATATAISAGAASFAAGLFEAAIEIASEGEAVLLAAYDIVARGPVAEVAPSVVPFASALVLSGKRSERSRACLKLYRAASEPTTPAPLAALAGNPMAVQALPLLAAIASKQSARVVLSAGAGSTLIAEVTP